MMNPRSGEDRLPAIEVGFQKNVTGEKRQQELLVPISPAVDCGVERKEDLKPLTGQRPSNILFVLIAGVQRVPGKRGLLAFEVRL
jgi:hypothetical protein